MAVVLAPLLDRDISLLHFNQRVFEMAQDHRLPLLERLRYLCIVSSNLDEFFEVRMEPHLTAAVHARKSTGKTPDSFVRILQKAHQLVAAQYELHNHILTPAFAEHGIHILSHSDRSAEEREFVRQYFQRDVKPLLVPVALDPSHPFPSVANKSLNFIVKLSGEDAFGRENDIAIVKVPRILPRVIPLPKSIAGERTLFVLLSSVIRAHLHELFPDRKVVNFSQFRVTRNSDLSVDEDEVVNLRMALRQGLQHRQFGRAVRLEVSNSCPDDMAELLLNQFDLPEDALFRVHGPVNLVRLTQFIDQVKRPEMLYPIYTASFPKLWPKDNDTFSLIKQQNVLIHQPYESFDAVVRFLFEAVHDPDTLAIKMTVYRTGTHSVFMDLLTEAVRRGKEVMVVVELKARFDEEANINWAERLEKIGAQVVYGVLGLKTHAKMLIVTRREQQKLVRYAHLSTGNYNPKTAALYTDYSYLTADPKMVADIDHVFQHLASQVRIGRLNHLLVAPFTLHTRLVGLIRSAARTAKAGGEAKIIAKMNSLTDEKLVLELIAAGQAGVKIDLIVRGACILPAGVSGVTDNIRVVSIIGRFLEHARVFYFKVGDDEKLYLSSADWMSRNMFRRIEIAWPVVDESLKQRIIEESLLYAMNDYTNAWQLQADGTYVRLHTQSKQRIQGVQAQLIRRYAQLDNTL